MKQTEVFDMGDLNHPPKNQRMNAAQASFLFLILFFTALLVIAFGYIKLGWFS